MIAEPERALVLAYSPDATAARALAALLALDDRLAETVRTTTEPMLGQIRLKWWYDALTALDGAVPLAEPVLIAVASDVLPNGIAAGELAAMADGWGELLGDVLDEAVLHRFAVRGRVLFAAAGRLAGADVNDPLGRAGEGWALAGLVQGLSDTGEVELARRMAGDALAEACAVRWSRNGRALGAMAQLARLDLAGSPVGSPRRVGRALWHRMTGR